MIGNRVLDHLEQNKGRTMEKLKCPFCQQELQDSTLWECYACRNPNCKHLLGYGTKELWQALDRTKKQLEMAINVIDTCRQYERGTACIAPDNLAVYCDIAIEHIKEPEQKDE